MDRFCPAATTGGILCTTAVPNITFTCMKPSGSPDCVQGPTASMGIYVNSGSIYESPRHSGSSALLECLAFKSTTHRSATRITNEVQCHNANLITI